MSQIMVPTLPSFKASYCPVADHPLSKVSVSKSYVANYHIECLIYTKKIRRGVEFEKQKLETSITFLNKRFLI